MAEYEASRTIAAPPELVFDEASDLRMMDRWLPREVHLESADPPDVTVSHGAHADRERAVLRARREQMRMEWGTRDTGEYAGWLQVAGQGTGASEVIVHLSFFDPEHAPPGPRIEAALDAGLERLADAVRQRGSDDQRGSRG